MKTALDTPQELLDDGERSFVAMIKEHGWFDTSVFADDEGSGFSYTSGFWVNAQKPELIVFGLKNETAHNILWDLFRDAKSGVSLPDGQRTNQVLANLPVYAFPVAKRFYPEYLGWNRWLYRGDDFPCWQIVWSDRAGIFPWEAGHDPAFKNDQPDLSENGWLSSLND